MKWAIDQEQPQKVTDNKQRVLVCQSEVGLVVVSPEKPNLKDVFKVVYAPKATCCSYLCLHICPHAHMLHVLKDNGRSR